VSRVRLRLAAALLALGCTRPAPPAPTAPPQAPVPVAQEGPVRGPEAPAPATGLPDFPEAMPGRWEALGEGVMWRGATVDFPASRTAADAPARLRWVVVRVALGRAALRVEPLADARLDGLVQDVSVRAALNAGFFEPDLRPSGAVVSDGRVLFPPTPRGGTGLVAIAEGRARLVPIARDAGVDAVPAGASLVVQCSPRLIEADGSVGIHRDDGRRAARSALCLRDQGRTLDLIATWNPASPGDGPGLLHLAQRLAGPSPVGDPTGCEAALNLDGGPSTAMLVRSGDAGGRLHPPRGPVPWALVLRVR
jgi:hypothetical protein